MRVLKQNAGSLVTDPQARRKKTKQKNTKRKKKKKHWLINNQTVRVLLETSAPQIRPHCRRIISDVTAAVALTMQPLGREK